MSQQAESLTLPVLRVMLTDVDFTSEFWQAAEWKFAPSMVLRAEYYSTKLDTWEPFVEGSALAASKFTKFIVSSSFKISFSRCLGFDEDILHV